MFQASLIPSRFVDANGFSHQFDSLLDQNWFAFCGIGNPRAFQLTLAQFGLAVSKFKSYADHHHFSTNDIETMATDALNSGCSAIVCTSKDLVKIGPDENRIPIYAIETELVFHDDDERLLLERLHRVYRKSQLN